MINLITYFYQYTKLIYQINQYINIYQNKKSHDIIYLEKIIRTIKNTGSVAIKFCQWIIPKLEIIYLEENEILSEHKPIWLKKLEELYEDCNQHGLEYTIQEYQRIFNEKLTDNYEILDILGSGSIGQVYLIKSKPLTQYSIPQEYVLKILHPNVKNEIYYFRLYYHFVKRIPTIKRYIQKYFPFDIGGFINDFEIQSNFINESNNLLTFQEDYRENNMIIIPNLIKCSQNIMIMSYEKGVTFEDSNIDDYHKSKIALLLTGFIRNNQQICNFHHGDLHKGNWKVKFCSDNKYRLIVYDYGFCWKVPLHKKSGINGLIDIFEDSDVDSQKIDYHKMTNIIVFLLKYDEDKKDIIYDKVYKYLLKNSDKIKPWVVNPSRLLKLNIDLCLSENLKIDHLLIQAIIIMIQCQKIFQDYKLISTEKNLISTKNVYRNKYLDWLSFYKTYHIFPEFGKLITDKLNSTQIEIESIFDCADMPESIKKLALSK